MATVVNGKSQHKKKGKTKNVSKEESEPIVDEKLISVRPNIEVCKLKPLLDDKSTPETTNIETCELKTDDRFNIETEVKEHEDDISQLCAIDYTKRTSTSVNESHVVEERMNENVKQTVEPSAPVLEEHKVFYPNLNAVVEEQVPPNPKKPPMTLGKVVQLFGGKEMAEVRAISVQEEAIVDAGPTTSPDHPLMEYLITLRSSLKAVEKECNRIAKGYVEEEKLRSDLWKVYPQSLNISENCSCGAAISFDSSFDVADFDAGRLPAAKLRLESLLQDVEESYCLHQHIALQTHYDVDVLMYKILQSRKDDIREALFLIFQAMKFCDGATETYAQALQRWACILSKALLDGESENSLRYFMFFLHNIFRQTRSVEWAGSVLQPKENNSFSAATVLVLLEVILMRRGLKIAEESTEENWEELDDNGEGCAVEDGRMRERDLLALLQALPLKNFISNLTLSDKTEAAGGWVGHGVLKASCGVRTLLLLLTLAAAAYRGYARALRLAAALAVAALHSLAALHVRSRKSYNPHLADDIQIELEACYAAGIVLMGDEAYKVPTTLLSPSTCRAYCQCLIENLHCKETVTIEELDVTLQPQPCAVRVRNACVAALQRTGDGDWGWGAASGGVAAGAGAGAAAADWGLASLMEFLFNTGVRRLERCGRGCQDMAKELLPELLVLYPELHTSCLHLLAQCHKHVTQSELSSSLAFHRWRPTVAEVRSVLAKWTALCPALVSDLLLGLDYTPRSGLSLESQLAICAWLCEHHAAQDWAWRVMVRVRVHRAHWPPLIVPLLPTPSTLPSTLLHDAFALLATEWGHCLPMVCGAGVEALARVCGARPSEGAHFAALLMRVMAQSPESVSLTPKFSEVLSMILNGNPGIVQRTLRWSSVDGRQLLRELLLSHLMDTKVETGERTALLLAWMRALQPTSAAGRALLDAGVRATRDWLALEAHTWMLAQAENVQEHILVAVREVSTAPLLCESLLRVLYAAAADTHVRRALLAELHLQRVIGARTQVGIALKKVDRSRSTEDLLIYRAATAALDARMQHPGHLIMWRLFLYMYLERPPVLPSEPSPLPVGPLFFSGVRKSRTFVQLKKRLDETIGYHHMQVNSLQTSAESTPLDTVDMQKVTTTSTDNTEWLPTLGIADLIAVSSERDGSPSDDKGKVQIVQRTKDNQHVLRLKFHIGAEKVLRLYLMWLDQGQSVQAHPMHVEISGIITVEVINAAWSASLEREEKSAEPSAATPFATPSPASPLHAPFVAPATHSQRARNAVRALTASASTNYEIPPLPRPLDAVIFLSPKLLCDTVDEYLSNLIKMSDEWSAEARRVQQLDECVWEYVRGLHSSRALPAVRVSCARGCPPTTLHIAATEWIGSTGVAQALGNNRRSARRAVLQLARPHGALARISSRISYLIGRISQRPEALSVAERACSAVGRLRGRVPVRDVLAALVCDLGQRFISADSVAASQYLRRWARGSPEQQRLCGALVAPSRLSPDTLPRLYETILDLPVEPHVAFSFLSKFNMGSWAEVAQSSQRLDMLRALLDAAVKIGSTPNPQDMVLLEILSKHSSVVLRERELFAHIVQCTRAIRTRRLPATYCTYLPEAAFALSHRLDYNQLGGLLRDVGNTFWEIRNKAEGKDVQELPYAQHAPHFTGTLFNLVKRFVCSALSTSMENDKVVYCTISALHESWSPWVAPSTTPALTDDDDATVQYCAAVSMVMEMVPERSDLVLLYVWQWVVGLALEHPGSCGLLTALANLPWNQPWFHADCLVILNRVADAGPAQLRAWCAQTLSALAAAHWLRGAAQPPSSLAAALRLLTHAHMPLHDRILREACELPWQQLPNAAVEETLENYFRDHYSTSVPYHRLPHFRLMLSACMLVVTGDFEVVDAESAGGPGGVVERRARSLSQWVRAAINPALSHHVESYTVYQLDVFSNLAPHTVKSTEELEALLGRALAVMSVEHAAAVALPVWEKWTIEASPGPRWAMAGALSSVILLDQFAALADAIAKGVMREKESAGWTALSQRWAACAWCGAGALWERGRLHAAYAALLARPHAPADLALALASIANLDINFSENHAIISLWICAICRIAVQCSRGSTAVGQEGKSTTGVDEEKNAITSDEMGRQECAEAARALLLRWAEQRRSLLQLVSMQSTHCPAVEHRALCWLALCILSPTDSTVQAFEAALQRLPGAAEMPEAMELLEAARVTGAAGLGGSGRLAGAEGLAGAARLAGAAGMAGAPRRGIGTRPLHLPRLAAALHPTSYPYFTLELHLMPDTF